MVLLIRSRLAIIFVLALGVFAAIDPLNAQPGEKAINPTSRAIKKTTDFDSNPSSEAIAFFEKKIRPILVAECYECHASASGKKTRGGLALDVREGIRKGGVSGPAIVAGDPVASLLIKAMRHADAGTAMPPKKKLDAAIVRDFEEWIRIGAPDPRNDVKIPDPSGIDIELGRKHWAYQTPNKTTPPVVRCADWPATEIDRFVLASLEKAGLEPSADADRGTWLRRVSFDLIGLPPTLGDIEEFTSDKSPLAFEKVVDRLLASPRFGEKWARNWLDVARYAESTGKTVNFYYPHAWRYRDYVIAAFNADKPYDRFVREQLAGDLMPTTDPSLQAERLVATGFLAIGPKTLNERSGVRFELDVVDEQIDVTTQAFLGITVACARCHDHKSDPFPARDYYALAGIFRSTETCYGTVRFINAQRPGGWLGLPAEAKPVVAAGALGEAERARIENQIKSIRESMKTMKDQVRQFFAAGQISLLQARLDAHEADGSPKLLAMGVRDKPAGPEINLPRDRFVGPGGFSAGGFRVIADSPVHIRGEPDQPGNGRVPRGTLQVISRKPLSIPTDHSGRLELAEWIASKENPLTARVMANRLWLQMFGRGLVPCADDFGMGGRSPTHPELLDYLAVEFMDSGWSVKKLVRRMALSRVYRQGSAASPKAHESDPDNLMMWRMAPRRLSAEGLRDALLAVSDQLEATPPIGSVVARAGEGPVNQPRPAGDSVSSAINDPRNKHRSIYLPMIRDNVPESLAIFDAADPSLIIADRPRTTVPSQGLYLMNNSFVLRAADAAAERLLISKLSDGDRIESAFARILGRKPSPRERTAAEGFLKAFEARVITPGKETPVRERERWSAFCQALFASAEFQYRY